MDVTLLGKSRAALLCFFTVCLTGLIHAQQHTISSFSPSNANTGEVVTITGANFSSITAVNFGGTAASSFTVVSTTSIRATVAAGTSGSVTVVKTGFSNASSAGFVFSSYPTITRIISDYNGYWDTNTTTNNSVLPDNSHNLLAFTYGGTTYATGVNNATLTNRGVTYTAGVYKALPASLSGTTPSSSASFFLAVGAKKDGSLTSANVTNASIRNLTPETILVDGSNGLDLGTGYTNLPASAISNYTIKSIDPSKVSDSEPDIVITQIAQPTGSIDTFQFVKSDGTTSVGNAITVTQNSVSKLGTWALDLFNFTTSVSYANAKPTSVATNGTNTTREIRLVSFKLSDFGINGSNYNQVGFLKLTPSSTSDVAFIAYNANAINIPPVVTINTSATSSNVCLSGTSPAYLSVNTISGSGASLSYSWEVSTNGGTSWSPVTNDATYSGATTANLAITAGTDGYKYRATVYETASPSISAVSPEFTIVAQTSTALAGTLNPGNTDITMCLNDPAPTTTTLTVAPTGGVGTFGYQWQQSTTSATTGFSNIAGANAKNYDYPYNALGTVYYRVVITSGCLNTASTAVARKVITSGDGILAVTNNSRCNTGTVTLSATSVSGTSSNINWYAAETGGTALTGSPGASFDTGSISATTTYYVGTTTSSPTCNSVRTAVKATIASGITLSSSNFSVPSTTTVCPGSASTVYVSTTALPDETYTVTYSVSGANTVSGTTASLTLVNGFGTFSTSALNTAGSNTITISNVQNGADCSFAPSSGNTASITVNAASVGGSIAGSATVCTGTNSTNLTLSGHTGSITKWQSSSSSDFSTGVSDIANTATSLSATNLTATTYYYRAVVANASCASANSSSATVTVSPTSVGGSVSGGTTVCSGTNSTDLVLSGSTGSIQWQSSSNNASFNDITEATSNTYNVSNISAVTYYRAVVSSGVCSSATSSSVSMNVNSPSVAGTATGSTTVCAGSNSSDVSVSGHTGIIQWQISANNSSFSDIFSATSTTYSATDLSATRYYRAVITSGVCSSATTNAVTITVQSTSTGGTLSGSATVPAGANSTGLSVSGFNGSIQKWQSSTTSDFSSSVTDINTTSTTYTATNLSTTTYYRVVVANGVCSAANSNIVAITVDPTLGGTLTGGASYCSTTNSTTLTLSGYSGSISKWQSSPSSDFSVNTVDIPNTVSTLQVTNVGSTTYYRAVITNGGFATKYSTTATITYNTSTLTIGNINGLQSLCGINQTTYAVDTVVGATNYVWTFPAGISAATNTSGNSVVVNVDPLFQEGTITVKAYNACNSTIIKSIDVLKKPIILTISGPTSTCSISTGTYAAVLSPIDQNAAYTWTVPNGFTITSGAGTSSITVSIDNNIFTGTGYVNAQAVSACGTSPIKYFTVSAVQAPTTIIGNEQVCGLTTASYRTPAVSVASSYTWTVPTGMAITSGQGTNQINVSIDQNVFTNGDVTVATNYSCGTSNPRTLLVNKAQKPGNISGPTALCGISEITYDTNGNIVNYSGGNVTYSIPAVPGATNYTWSVPAGATIVTGQGSKSITVTFDYSIFSSGTIVARFTNQCGTSLPSTLAVKRSGAFITGYTQLCNTVSNITYSIPNTVGSSFSWHVPSWMTIVSGQGTNLLTVSVTGNICSDTVSLDFVSNCNTNETASLAVGCTLSSKLVSGFCGSAVSSEFTQVYANTVSGASSYTFRVIKGASTQYITNATPYFTINQVTGWAYGDAYTVDVAPVIGGVTYNYGCSCSLTLNTPAPSIQSTQCGTTLASIDTRIYCSNITTASAYRFKVTNGGTTRTIDTSTNNFQLSQLSGGVTYSTAYSVSVSAFYNGGWSAYGTVCTISTPNVPTTKINASLCGTTLASVWTTLYAGQLPGVTIAGYRYEVTDTNTSTIYTVDSSTSNFNLMQISGGARYATTYSIRVAVSISGTWQVYGTSCNVTTPDPLTKVVPSQCGTTLGSMWTPVFANSISGATAYSFEVTNGGSIRTIVRNTNSFQLPLLSGGAALNTTYSIRVAAIYNGTLQPYGAACNVSTGSARLSESLSTIVAFNAQVFPNPFESNFGLSIDTQSQEIISVQVFDMLGKQVDARSVSAQEIGSVSLGENYPSGVYQIIVTQGDNTKVLRAIKR